MALKVRPLTAQETDAVKRFASSRTAPHRVVQRAQIIWTSVQGESVPERRVIGLDELGPVSTKTYPGEVWMCGPGRATFTPDYGRRGSVWGLGTFEPATGLASMLYRPRRDSASVIQLLEQVSQTYPAQEWVLITDNLSTHASRETQTALIAWPEVTLLFIPKYACWLNLIEPWQKQLRSLALKGQRCERIDEVIEAILEAKYKSPLKRD